MLRTSTQLRHADVHPDPLHQPEHHSNRAMRLVLPLQRGAHYLAAGRHEPCGARVCGMPGRQ